MVMLDPGIAAAAEPGAQDFESFFRTHYGRVYALLYRVTGRADAADDLAQEVFLKVAQRRPALWNDPGATGWLWKAATHTALDALRSERRRRDRELRAAQAEAPQRGHDEWALDPAAEAARAGERRAVRAALHQLSERDSALLLLRHSGLAYAEIAAALGLRPNSVGALLARAEKRFKEVYRG